MYTVKSGGTKVKSGGTKVKSGGTKVKSGGTKVKSGGTKVKSGGTKVLTSVAVHMYRSFTWLHSLLYKSWKFLSITARCDYFTGKRL